MSNPTTPLKQETARAGGCESDRSPANKKHRAEAGTAIVSPPPTSPLSHVSLEHLNVKLMFLSGKSIGADPSSASAVLRYAVESIATSFGDSCVVLVVRVASPQETLAESGILVGHNDNKCGGSTVLEKGAERQIGASRFIHTVKKLSADLIDESFFVFSPSTRTNEEESVVVGSINSLPIVVVVCGDEEERESEEHCNTILSELDSMKPLGPYLSNFSEKAENDEPFPTLSVNNLPCAVMFTQTNLSPNSTAPTRIVQKIKVANAGVIHSLALLPPAHDEDHLVREILRAVKIRKQLASQQGEDGIDSLDKIMKRFVGTSVLSSVKCDVSDIATVVRALREGCDSITSPLYVVLYAGASWCPPCMRIIREIPSMLTGLDTSVEVDGLGPVLSTRATIAKCGGGGKNKSVEADVPLATVCSMIKVDYDTSPSILKLFGIETIPTFVVLDLKKLVASPAVAEFDREPRESLQKMLRDALVTDPLQNSQRPTVAAYFAKSCSAPLSFTLDEDF